MCVQHQRIAKKMGYRHTTQLVVYYAGVGVGWVRVSVCSSSIVLRRREKATHCAVQ
jgi:hypothetical protein